MVPLSPRLTETLTASRADQGGGSFTGNLYLDSGELLGLVQGQISAADGQYRTTILNGKKGN